MKNFKYYMEQVLLESIIWWSKDFKKGYGELTVKANSKEEAINRSKTIIKKHFKKEKKSFKDFSVKIKKINKKDEESFIVAVATKQKKKEDNKI